jgi:hypothetical protein
MDKSIVERLKILVAKFDTTEAPAAFADVTLADGTIISYEGDMPVVGASVMFTDMAGVQGVAPDGEYQLPDGTLITVAGGLITELGTWVMEPGAEGMEAAAADAELKALLDKLFGEMEKIAPLTEKITALEAQNAELKSAIAAFDSTKKLAEDTFNIVEKLAAEPSVEPTKTATSGASSFSSMKTMKEIADAAKQIRKDFKY